MKIPLNILLLSASLLLDVAISHADDPRVWTFPVRYLARQNVELSIGEGARNIKVWACQPQMAGPLSVSGTPQHRQPPAGQFKLTIHLKLADVASPKPVVRLQVTEEGTGATTDVTLYTSDFDRAGAYVDWQMPLEKCLDSTRLVWTLTYLNQVPVWIDEVSLLPIYRCGDLPPPVEIIELHPARLISSSDATPDIDVRIKNYTLTRQVARLDVWLEGGVADNLWHERRDLDIEPLASVEFCLPGRIADRQFGFSVRAELRQDDKLVDRRSDVFAVADNFNQVSQYGAAAPDGNPERFPASLATYRRAAIGAIEVDFWAPCDFSGMAPKESGWIAGQGLRRIRKQDLQQPIEAAHSQGIRMLTYGDLWLSGSAGFEFARRHPEQIVWGHMYYGGEFDVDQLDALRADDLEQARKSAGWSALTPQLADATMQRFTRDEVLRSVKMFGWDGIRYDSEGLSIIGGENLLGVLPSAEQGAAATNAELIRWLRDQWRRESPRLVYGDNVGSRYGANPPDVKWQAEAADGGMIMDEGIGQVAAAGRWRDLARQAVLAARTARECGGYQVNIITPILPRTTWPARPYPYILTMAAGAHVAYAAPEHGTGMYCRFAMRYGELLYDLAARPLIEAASPFAVEADVWWQDYVTRRDLADGRRQYIVSLINPPTCEQVAELMRAIAPRTRVPVTFAVPHGERVTGAWALEPETEAPANPLAVQGHGQLRLSVPRLEYWMIVVVETTTVAATAEDRP